MKKSKHTPWRSCVLSFVMTLMLCISLLLAGIAWNNTASALYGDATLVAVEPVSPQAPQISFHLLDKIYTADVSALNEAAKYLQIGYPAVPRTLRLITSFFSGITQGIDSLADYLF